jgi:hypothetical protein
MAAGTSMRGFGEPDPVIDCPESFRSMTLEQRRKAEVLLGDVAQVRALNPDEDSSDDEAARPTEEREPTWEERTGSRTIVVD